MAAQYIFLPIENNILLDQRPAFLTLIFFMVFIYFLIKERDKKSHVK